MSQNIYVDRTLQFNKGGGGTPKIVMDTDDSTTILYILPTTDATEYVAFGNATLNMDVKMFGNTSGNYLLWDESADSLLLTGTSTRLTIAGTTTSTSTTTGALTVAGGFGVAGAMFLGGTLTLSDACDIVLNTATGTKIGTATTQKLGFFNAAPVVRPAAYTQTYSTADKTHAASTFAAVVETASTSSTPYGYTTAAQANNICIELNDLADDVVDLKQLVNSVIDDLQTLGLVS